MILGVFHSGEEVKWINILKHIIGKIGLSQNLQYDSLIVYDV